MRTLNELYEVENLVQDVAYFAQGTTNSISCIADIFKIEEDEVLLILEDQEIFECEECGWWCEASELSEDEESMICDNCYEE